MLFILQYALAGAILGALLGTWRKGLALVVIALIVSSLISQFGVSQGNYQAVVGILSKIFYSLYALIAFISFSFGVFMGVFLRNLYEEGKKVAENILEGEESKES